MSLTLILMRHAKSSWDQPGLNDHARPLNARGRASATAMGDWLRREGFVPDSTLCSTSERTRETFQRLGLTSPVTYLDTLYHAPPEAMLQELRRARGTTVLMIGHNPGIAEFAEQIVHRAPDHDRFEDFPTCATLVATFDAENWGKVAWGQGHVARFAIPREVLDKAR